MKAGGGQVKALAKTAAVQTASISSINNGADTVITLPKSGKVVSISKDLPADKIKMLDKYFSKHKNIPTQIQIVSPMMQACNDRIFLDWEEENQYQSVPGKHLGIWDEQRINNWQNYYNLYGFNEIFLGSSSEFAAANDNNNLFKTDSILAGLSKTNYQANVQSWYPLGIHRFEFDEPLDSFSPPNLTVDELVSYTNWIYSNYSNTKVAYKTYEPNGNPYFPWYQSAIRQTYNSYIMCDQYQDGQSYMWQHYSAPNYFGTDRANIGGNWVDYNHDYSENMYSTLFSVANNLGINQIWFYADDPSDPSNGLNAFLYAAWANGWLLKCLRQFYVEYKCNGDCTNCDWPNGNFYIARIWYTGLVQYIAY